MDPREVGAFAGMYRGLREEQPYASEKTWGDVYDDLPGALYNANPVVPASLAIGALQEGDYLSAIMNAATYAPILKAAAFLPGLKRVGPAVDDIADTFDLPPGPDVGAFRPAAPAVVTGKDTLGAKSFSDYIATQARDNPRLDYDAFNDIGRVLQAPGVQQGAPSEMLAYAYKRKPSQHVKNLSHPAHKERLRAFRDVGLFEGPDGQMVNPWFYPGPLSEKWNDVLGGPLSESDTQLQKFFQAMGPTSIQTNVSDNIREASLVYPNLLRGDKISDLTHGKSDLTGASYGEKLNKLQQIQSGNFPDAAGVPTSAHKIYNYARNMQGEGAGAIYPNSPVTLDSQMAEVMRLRGTKGQDLERFTGPAYPYGEEVIRGLGREVNAAGADTEAAIWQAYLASKHGAKVFGSRYGDSLARAVEDRVNKTATQLGMDPEDVWKGLINGDQKLLSAAGLGAAASPAGVGAFSDDEEVY